MARTGRPRGPNYDPRYGNEHKLLRAQYKTAMMRGATFHCPYCKTAINPLKSWHLAHRDDGGYLGPACASCNVAAAFEKGDKRKGRAPQRDLAATAEGAAPNAGINDNCAKHGKVALRFFATTTACTCARGDDGGAAYDIASSFY